MLAGYGISQNQLATMMGIDRCNLSRWVSGERDPIAEAVYEINKALRKLNPEASKAFVSLYLDDPEQEEE